jgi:hypothetical protein
MRAEGVYMGKLKYPNWHLAAGFMNKGELVWSFATRTTPMVLNWEGF